jgi:hypothetical protein
MGSPLPASVPVRFTALSAFVLVVTIPVSGLPPEPLEATAARDDER